MKELHLAFVGGRGLYSNYGGVENAIREITNVIADKSDVSITVYGTSTKNIKRNIPKSIRVANCPTWLYEKLGQYGIVLWSFFHLAFVSRPDVVFLFASGPCIFTPFLRLMGIKVVSSLRAIDSERDKWGVISRTILQTGEYFAWRYANVFTVNSKEMYEVYSKYTSEVLFIPNGAKTINTIPKGIIEKYDLVIDEYILFAARIDPVKRLHLLISAHNNLPSKNRIKLVIAGGNAKDQQYLNTQIKKANCDISFVGHLEQEELECLLQGCRAFISPSILEGMSNSILSAMINGKAVLAADIKANTDILNSTEAVFPADDLNSLEAGLLRIANDKKFCERLGNNLQNYAQENFSWQNTAEKFYNAAILALNKNESK